MGSVLTRMQMTRGMRIREAEEYVANKLSVSGLELSDPVIMAEVRDDLNIGLVRSLPHRVKGIDAKFRIAEVLGIEINCVNRFKERVRVKF